MKQYVFQLKIVLRILNSNILRNKYILLQYQNNFSEQKYKTIFNDEIDALTEVETDLFVHFDANLQKIKYENKTSLTHTHLQCACKQYCIRKIINNRQMCNIESRLTHTSVRLTH